MKDLQTSNPMELVQNMRSEIEKLVDHLRQDVSKVDDPKAKALF